MFDRVVFPQEFLRGVHVRHRRRVVVEQPGRPLRQPGAQVPVVHGEPHSGRSMSDRK